MIRVSIISILVLGLFWILPAQDLRLGKKDLKILVTELTGAFSTDTQLAADSSTYQILLHNVPLWSRSKNGYWLYCEQSTSTDLEKPYRQRVYNFILSGDTAILSQMYEIANPARYAGGWKDPSKLEALTPDSLAHRQGCGMYIHKGSDGAYRGTTPSRSCPSGIRGAAFASSEWIIRNDEFTSWDRGFDQHGVQVWGPIRGPYVFKRQQVNQP